MNVVELVVRLIDQLTGPLRKTKGEVNSFQKAVKDALKGLTAAFVFREIVRNTSEAEEALAQLEVAFQNSAESARRSREEILRFSDAAQRRTAFGDEAVTQAQTVLLRFGRVSGEVFDRARQSALDLSAALGTDLRTAAFAVGRALQSPAQGVRELRTYGILFTADQLKLIRTLEATGRIAEAQTIILEALQNRFSGAAEAARNTLGGALAGLKNAFGDLFEATDRGSNKAAQGLNEITRVISDPKFRSSVQSFVGETLEWLAAFGNLISKTIEGWQFLLSFVVKETPSALDRLLEKQNELGASLNRALDAKSRTQSEVERASAQRIIDRARAELEAIQSQIESVRQGQGRPQAIGNHQMSQPGGTQFISQAEIDQRNEDARLRAEEAWKRQVEAEAEVAKRRFEIQEMIRRFGEQQGGQALEQIQRTRDLLEETTDKAKEGFDKALEPITRMQNGIKAFVDTAKEGFANLALSGEVTGRAILKFLLSAFLSRALYRAIDQLGDYLQKTLTSSGGGGGAGGFIGSFIGSVFGHAAGGGRSSKPRIVGEEGPELLFDSGMVMNRRQLAFAMAGGGGTVNMGDTQIVVQGANNPEVTAQIVETRIQQNNKKQLENMQRLLERNGYGGLR